MKTIADGAQLKNLAEKCGSGEKELAQFSISMNKELNNLTEAINTQIETVDDQILVTYYISTNRLNIYLINCIC